MKCKVSEARISTNGLMIKHKGAGEGMRLSSSLSYLSPPKVTPLSVSLSPYFSLISLSLAPPPPHTLGGPWHLSSLLGCWGRNGRKNWGTGGIRSTPMPVNLEPNIKDTKNKFILRKEREFAGIFLHSALHILQDFSLPKWKHKPVFWRSVTSWPADSIKSLWRRENASR